MIVYNCSIFIKLLCGNFLYIIFVFCLQEKQRKKNGDQRWAR